MSEPRHCHWMVVTECGDDCYDEAVNEVTVDVFYEGSGWDFFDLCGRHTTQLQNEAPTGIRSVVPLDDGGSK